MGLEFGLDWVGIRIWVGDRVGYGVGIGVGVCVGFELGLELVWGPLELV